MAAAAAVSHPQVVALSASQLQNKSFSVDSKQSETNLRFFHVFQTGKRQRRRRSQKRERDEKKEQQQQHRDEGEVGVVPLVSVMM